MAELDDAKGKLSAVAQQLADLQVARAHDDDKHAKQVWYDMALDDVIAVIMSYKLVVYLRLLKLSFAHRQ